MAVTTRSEQRAFKGMQGSYQHSTSRGQSMRLGVYRPDCAGGNAPALIYLAGLTCSEETFVIKAGAQRLASDLGLILVTPDTSPRDTGIEAASGEWDFGEGAGFYLDATETPYAPAFAMEHYVTQELPLLLGEHFGVDVQRMSITGHSMGGHGALTLALRHPGLFVSVSAFAPIAAPSLCPWGEKAFTRYLGHDRLTWQLHDASALMRRAHCPYPEGILIDQGLSDQFLAAQLMPEQFEQACSAAEQPLTLRRHAGFDHSYFFISTFIDDHLQHHARALGL